MMRFCTKEERELHDTIAPWTRAKMVNGDVEVYLDPETPEEVKKAYRRLQKVKQEQWELVGFG